MSPSGFVRLGTLVVASQNPDKIREIDGVLRSVDPDVEIITGLEWPEVDETESTLEGNALLKAHAVYRYTGHVAVSDDTGLEVAALDGAPGVLTARFAGPDASYGDNMARLLAELDGVADRRARFRTVIAMVGAGADISVEGVLEGVIAKTPRGAGGFGYDPIFEVDGVTLAEMDPAEKQQISHRALALQALVNRLRDEGLSPAHR